MRALIDAQLPPALCGWFAEQGVEAEHVIAVLGVQTADAAIAGHAIAGLRGAAFYSALGLALVLTVGLAVIGGEASGFGGVTHRGCSEIIGSG